MIPFAHWRKTNQPQTPVSWKKHLVGLQPFTARMAFSSSLAVQFLCPANLTFPGLRSCSYTSVQKLEKSLGRWPVLWEPDSPETLFLTVSRRGRGFMHLHFFSGCPQTRPLYSQRSLILCVRVKSEPKEKALATRGWSRCSWKTQTMRSLGAQVIQALVKVALLPMQWLISALKTK